MEGTDVAASAGSRLGQLAVPGPDQSFRCAQTPRVDRVNGSLSQLPLPTFLSMSPQQGPR